MEIEFGGPRAGEASVFADAPARALAAARLAAWKIRMLPSERREWEVLLYNERVARQVAETRQQARTRLGHPPNDTSAG
jgi:hypothetical protein